MKHPVKVYWRQFKKLQKRGTQSVATDKALMSEHQCLNCGMTYAGNFCPYCGQSAKTERFTVRQTLRHLLFFFTKFDDKFKNTVVDLCYRPGYMIRDYIKGHRVNYMRPLQMLVCLITVYLLIMYCFKPEAEPVHLVVMNDDNGVDVVQQFLADHPFLAFCRKVIESSLNNRIISTVSLVVFLTIPSWLSFRRKDKSLNYNMAEHFYALTYVACMTMILNFIVLPYSILVGDFSYGGLVNFIIVWWVYCQLFDFSRRKGLFRLILMMVLAMAEIIIICLAIVGVLALLGVID